MDYAGRVVSSGIGYAAALARHAFAGKMVEWDGGRVGLRSADRWLLLHFNEPFLVAAQVRAFPTR